MEQSLPEIQIPVSPVANLENKKETLLAKITDLFIEIIAIFFWVYTIVKLFIFDVDIYLLKLLNPHLVWILNYKFPILLVIILIAMLVNRSLTLGLSVLYIAFYPLIFIFWKIPKFLWGKKSWLLTFAVINSVISFFRSFKRYFILGTLFIICALLVISLNNIYVLYVSAFTMLVILVVVYVFTFIKAFKPSAVFQLYTKIFPAIRNSDFLKIDTAISGLPVEQLDIKQIETRANSLQNIVLYNRACLFIARKLKDYQRSGVSVISYIVSLVGLLIFTVISFGFMNYSLFKINPAYFHLTYENNSLFSFIYYSAGSMFYATNGLAPVLPLSQFIQMIQFLSAVLLIVILFAVVISLYNEKYSAELEEVIKAVEEEGQTIETLIINTFNLSSIKNAIEALKIAKTNLLGFIMYLSKNIGE